MAKSAFVLVSRSRHGVCMSVLPARVRTLKSFARNNFNGKLTLSADKQAWVVDEIEALPEGTQPQITVEELIECDELVRKDGKPNPLSANNKWYDLCL